MSVRTVAVHPIKRFLEQSIPLKAAFASCYAKPSPGAVHRLRTNIRRIEAQLELLDLLQDLPTHHREFGKLRRELKQVRRSAGKVRDLDIQKELTMMHSASMTPTDARQLRHWMKRHRDNETAALHNMLRRVRAKVYLTLDCLCETLHPLEHISLPATQLVALAWAWFVRHRRPSDTIEHLHATRKAAKLARYMAETARDSATATKIAKRLEAIQRAGGLWHDWTQVVEIAVDKLGKRHPLVESCKGQCDLSLRVYRRKIGSGLPRPSRAARRMNPSQH